VGTNAGGACTNASTATCRVSTGAGTCSGGSCLANPLSANTSCTGTGNRKLPYFSLSLSLSLWQFAHYCSLLVTTCQSFLCDGTGNCVTVNAGSGSTCAGNPSTNNTCTQYQCNSSGSCVIVNVADNTTCGACTYTRPLPSRFFQVTLLIAKSSHQLYRHGVQVGSLYHHRTERRPQLLWGTANQRVPDLQWHLFLRRGVHPSPSCWSEKLYPRQKSLRVVLLFRG